MVTRPRWSYWYCSVEVTRAAFGIGAGGHALGQPPNGKVVLSLRADLGGVVGVLHQRRGAFGAMAGGIGGGRADLLAAQTAQEVIVIADDAPTGGVAEQLPVVGIAVGMAAAIGVAVAGEAAQVVILHAGRHALRLIG